MKKLLFKYRWIIVVNVVFLVLATLVIFFIFKSRERENRIILPLAPVEVLNQDLALAPLKIIIPKIGVESPVEPVGKTKGGNMAVPKSFTSVGWYKYGAEPGDIGNAVLAGHVDNGAGKPGVFNKLSTLEIGDKIIVEEKGGGRVEFKVTGMQVVDYLDPPEEVLSQIFGTSTKSHLNLITCDGTWIPAKKIYTDRLIVFADKVEK